MEKIRLKLQGIFYVKQEISIIIIEVRYVVRSKAIVLVSMHEVCIVLVFIVVQKAKEDSTFCR